MASALGDLTVAATHESFETVDARVCGYLRLPHDEVGVDATAMRARPDPIRRNGIVQGLQDLGYLPEVDERDPQAFADAEIAAALRRWREDTLACPATYLHDEGGERIPLAPQTLDLDDPLPVLVMQTSFDATIRLNRMPRKDDGITLATRLLLYRLKTFNRYDSNVAAPLTDATMETLERLKAMMGLADGGQGTLAFLNALGDAARLSEAFCSEHASRVFVYADETQADANRVAGAYRLMNKIKRVRHAGKIGGGTRRFKTPVLVYHSRHAGRAPSLVTLFNSEENTLALELLQLRLWQNGYYAGAVDADWGERSREALDDLLGSVKDLESEIEHIRATARGGYVINLVYILKKLLPIVEEHALNMDPADVAGVSDRLFPENDDDAGWTAMSRRAQERMDETVASHVAKPVFTRRRGQVAQATRSSFRRRRIPFGIRSVASAIAGWFRRAWDALADAVAVIRRVAERVRKAILEGLRSVSSIFRFALTRTRAVVRVARAALQRLYYWVAGIPFGQADEPSASFVMTRWSVDFDTVNYIDRRAPETLVERHLARIAFMNASFSFMMAVALTVLEVIVTVVTQNWLKLAHAIAQLVRTIREWTSAENVFGDYLRDAQA